MPSILSGPETKGNADVGRMTTLPQLSVGSWFAKRTSSAPPSTFVSWMAARSEHSLTPNMPTETHAPVQHSPSPGVRSGASLSLLT